MLTVVACKQNPLDIDVSKVDIPFSIDRFEIDLFSENQLQVSEKAEFLRDKYKHFFPLFTHNIISVGDAGNPATNIYLHDFINDKDISSVYKSVLSKFPEPLPFAHQLNNAFKHFRYYFPSDPIPQVVTFISGFNYAIISADSVAGIGLDMYLGEDFPMYASMGLPQFKRAKMKEEFIITDCMKGWFQSEYEIHLTDPTFLDEIIHMGKILYLTEAMTPGAEPRLKFNYTQQQFNWCENNESNLWNHFLQRKLLYSKLQNEYAKFLIEAPTTSGFPPETPSQIGHYIGHRIVTQYMNQSKSTLIQLMQQTNAQHILQVSKYKPKQ